MLLTCPTCSQPMQCPPNAAGKKIVCPKCGQKILVPAVPIQSKPAAQNKTVLGKLEEVAAGSAPSPPLAVPPPIPSTGPPLDDREPEPQFTRCSFCDGQVARDAIKCRHCGETLDPGLRRSEEAKREAEMLAQSTDVFGVVGFIISLFSVVSLGAACLCGAGSIVAVPLGLAGAGCSLYGRGNLRVAGLVLNGIAVTIGLIIGALWLLFMAGAMLGQQQGQRQRQQQGLPFKF